MDFELINVQRSTKKIFDMSGLTRILKIKDKENELKSKINAEILSNINEEGKNEGII